MESAAPAPAAPNRGVSMNNAIRQAATPPAVATMTCLSLSVAAR